MHMVKATVFRTVQHVGRTVLTVHLCQCPRNGAVKVATGNWSMAQILFVIPVFTEVLSHCFGIKQCCGFFLPCQLSFLFILTGNFCGFCLCRAEPIVKVSAVFVRVHIKCTMCGCCCPVTVLQL